MKTLVLLSELTKNNNLVEKLKSIFAKKNFKLGYIPSQSDKTRKYFTSANEYFTAVGVNEIFYFDVDEEWEPSLLEELKTCDGIYLSGGNTFYFLKQLKERNMLTFIKEFVEDGKLLIGVSAGSILMSKTIEIAHLLDENSVDLQDLKALRLIDFEVMPHWGDVNVPQEKLKRQNSVYCLRDGDGIFIDGDTVKFVGNVQEIRGELNE